jgi:HK97 gp10 family phage protein
MAENLDISNGDFRIKVTGLRELVRNMERAGVEAQDIKEIMFGAGEIVAKRAAQLAPVRTGRLVGNIRVGKAKNKASIKVGSARVPYARFVYFGKFDQAKGGKYAKENPFIYNALKEKRQQVFDKIELGMQDLLEKNDLA